MTIDEFKAWLEGFGEAINDAPTPAQWAKIKTKINEVHAIKFDTPNKLVPFDPNIRIGNWPPEPIMCTSLSKAEN